MTWTAPTPTLDDVLNFIVDAEERLNDGDIPAALDALWEARETIEKVQANG